MSQSEDLKRASRETADRLRARGIRLTGHESIDELVTIEDAVERFEEAVISRGGDLMVDEGAPGRRPQPDDPVFALPARGERESVAGYLERIDQTTDAVRQHRPIA
jgi:hypothetical protein